jgi:hypothetical protein
LPEFNSSKAGLIPRMLKHLFESECVKKKSKNSDWEVTVSYFEIFAEKITDLLNRLIKLYIF